MNDFVIRQVGLILGKVEDFRRGVLSLNTLIQHVEGLSQAISEQLWADKVFPIVFDLERVNSEVIDKLRSPTADEIVFIEQCLSQIEILMRELLVGSGSK